MQTIITSVAVTRAWSSAPGARIRADRAQERAVQAPAGRAGRPAVGTMGRSPSVSSRRPSSSIRCSSSPTTASARPTWRPSATSRPSAPTSPRATRFTAPQREQMTDSLGRRAADRRTDPHACATRSAFSNPARLQSPNIQDSLDQDRQNRSASWRRAGGRNATAPRRSRRPTSRSRSGSAYFRTNAFAGRRARVACRAAGRSEDRRSAQQPRRRADADRTLRRSGARSGARGEIRPQGERRGSRTT